MVEAYNEAKKQEMIQANTIAHLQGYYMVDALLATVGNMFKGKGGKTFEYPKKPYELNIDGEARDEVEIQRRDFVTNLNNLFRNIDKTLKESEDGH